MLALQDVVGVADLCFGARCPAALLQVARSSIQAGLLCAALGRLDERKRLRKGAVPTSRRIKHNTPNQPTHLAGWMSESALAKMRGMLCVNK